MRKIDIDELNEHGKFAVILKCLLAKNNITQWELAEKVGMSNATITNYARGRYTPSHKTIEKIANALNVTPQTFYDDANEYTHYLNSVERIFAEKFPRLLIEKNVSQEELAKAVGVSRQAINYYANGKTMPTANVLKKISDYFSVSMQYFIEDDKKEENNSETKVVVNKMPYSKNKCPFIMKNYSHEYAECKMGGICDLNGEKCSHLCAMCWNDKTKEINLA